MNVRRVTAIVASAIIAVAVALLAADVRAWPAAIERGDALYALDPQTAQWSAQTRLGGLAGTMLGTEGDLAERRALQLYDQVIAIQQGLPFQAVIETARAYAISGLAKPAASTDRTVASQARTLQGVLAFDAAGLGGGSTQVNTAIADFTAALELDSGNNAAKFDLELLLRLGQSMPNVFPVHHPNFGHSGLGAAAAPAGHGY
ncbi:MAG: hypothetical protein ACRDLP_18210 [Solirubrobacteraceae bacterium]